MSDSTTELPNIHAMSIVVNAIVGIILATICLVLRVYVRAIMTKSWGLDDWVLTAAFISFLALTIISIIYGLTVRGNGLIDDFDKVVLVLEWHTFFYSVDQSFLKAALATLYLRILTQKSWQRTVIIASTSIYIAFTMILAFVWLFQCGDPLDVESTDCLNGDNLEVTSYVQAALNAFMDWLLTLLPFTVIFKTQMSKRTKISVLLIMLLGAAASAISVIRIFFLNTSNAVGYEGYARLTELAIMSYWENCIGQIAISLAALKPLWRAVFKSYGGMSTDGPTAATGHMASRTQQSQKGRIAVQHTYEVQADESSEEIELIQRSDMKIKQEV